MVDLYTNDWKIKNITTVLFDKDGTFIDSHIYWGRIIVLRVKAIMDFYNIKKEYFDELCLSLGYDTTNKILIEKGPIALQARETVINSLIAQLKKYDIEADSEKIANIFQKVHNEFLKEIYDYVKPIEDAEILFKRLKEKGVRLAIVTSDTKESTEMILKRIKFASYFDLIIGNDICSKPKKTGEPALIALKMLDADPQSTISVGDAPMDYEMAKNSKLKGSILVSTGQIPINKLKKLTNTTIHSLKEVMVK